jgi:hypothetical protein
LDEEISESHQLFSGFGAALFSFEGGRGTEKERYANRETALMFPIV